jgi:RecJ-like exonuclease
MKIKIEIPEVFAQPIEKEFDKGHVIVCNHCKGLGIIAESLLKGKREHCNKCGGSGYTHYLGECGEMHETTGAFCYKCFEIKNEKEEQTLYEKAKKVKPENYKGYVVGMHDCIEDIEDFLEDYRDNFDEDYPKWIFGTKVDYELGFDLIDSIENQINDYGYEDMIQDVNTDSEKLEKAKKFKDYTVKCESGSSQIVMTKK